ncbi:BIG5, partial [Symbiodinium pilosum]
MDEHRSVICPFGEAGRVLDVPLSCRVQAVCVVLLILILCLVCSCLWRSCWKGKSAPARALPEHFSAVPSVTSVTSEPPKPLPEARSSCSSSEASLEEGREMAKMASRYSIKSALSKWTRAKAKVRVVWKLNLQQVQSWLHGEGQGAPEVTTAASRPCEEAPSDATAEEVSVLPERGAPDEIPDASAVVGQSPAHCEDAHEAANFLCVDTIVCSNAWEAEREALPAYADGDRVEYFSPTCGLWLLGEATRKQGNEAPSFREVLDQVRAKALEGGLQLPPRVREEEAEDAAARCRDALLLLSNLCEQSVEEPGNGQADELRHLALTLTAKLLESCESTELSSKPFIAAVRRFFSVSLTRNSLSGGLKMTKLALRLVVVVSRIFGESLSCELGIFMDQIVLPVLVSGNSSYAQKHWMLQ